MDEKEFDQLAQALLTSLEEKLEVLDADIDFELAPGGILEIEFANGSKIIVNRHNVAKEIWVAAKSGGFHFKWDAEHRLWCDTRDQQAFFEKLSKLLSQQSGETVTLT